MEKFIPTNWVTNALLLVLVAAISYGIFLAIMVGTNEEPVRDPSIELPTPRTPTAQA